MKERVKKYLPPSGSVMLMLITEKQFSDMDICLGKSQSAIVDSDSKMVIL